MNSCAKTHGNRQPNISILRSLTPDAIGKEIQIIRKHKKPVPLEARDLLQYSSILEATYEGARRLMRKMQSLAYLIRVHNRIRIEVPKEFLACLGALAECHDFVFTAVA